jgi:general secretion pathway protein N
MILARKIAIALGSVAGALALLAAAQGMGLGSGFSLEPAGAAAAGDTPSLALERDTARMRAWGDYAQVLARPLFNESRAPEVEETADAGEAAAAQPLTVNLTGVILTRGVQIALVTDPARNETERVKVGQPLTGERAGWTLVELKPRAAVFEGAGLGRQELELAVDVQGAAPAAPAPAPAPAAAAPPATTATAQDPANPQPAAAAPAPGQPASADEIRRRIEERRRQLREEAQKMLQQGNSQ